jgi:hypothetical protein
MVALDVPLRHYADHGLKALSERLGRQPWPVIEALIQTRRLHLIFLEQVRVLPDAEAAITSLEVVLADPDPQRIGEAFAAVPFNYR